MGKHCVAYAFERRYFTVAFNGESGRGRAGDRVNGTYGWRRCFKVDWAWDGAGWEAGYSACVGRRVAGVGHRLSIFIVV